MFYISEIKTKIPLTHFRIFLLILKPTPRNMNASNSVE